MNQIEAKNLLMFSSLSEFLAENDSLIGDILPLIEAHLRELRRSIEHYFPTNEDPRIGFMWIQDPFVNIKAEHRLSPID